MTNEIGFNALFGQDVLPEIFEEASIENPSNICNYRLVSEDCRDQCETPLRKLWNQLKANPPKGVVDISSNIAKIEESRSEGDSAITSFSKLALVFKNEFGVDLSNKPLPIMIDNFKGLQQEIYDNALKTIWRGRLHSLHIGHRLPLGHLPSSGASAAEIRAFLCDPSNAAFLARLRRLDLMNLGLKVVPPEIERLTGIQFLNLSYNQLVEVPNLNLPHLTVLNLESNQLKTVPNFDKLPILTHLHLNVNKLKEVPDFNKSQHLIFLALSMNHLEKVPDFNLRQLTHLFLADNKLDEVPNFNNLRNLIWLFLNKNMLREVPNFNQPGLEKLYLDDNLIDMIPDFNLPQLKELGLKNNIITQVPNFNLPQLRKFDLTSNELKEVPNFDHLQSVKTFFLNNNRLIEIPAFNHMQSLTDFYLDGNRPLFISQEIRNRFPDEIVIRSFQNQLDHHCESSLADLYQTIIMQKSWQEQIEAFVSLDDQNDRNLIYEMVWEIAGKPSGDDQWGQLHAFEDPARFRLAVQKAILRKLDRLPDEGQDRVYREVHDLAGLPLQTYGCDVEEEFAKKNLPRLADALARVVS
jgi:hypothetical protein